MTVGVNTNYSQEELTASSLYASNINLHNIGVGVMMFTTATVGSDVINIYAGAELVASLAITVVDTGAVTKYFNFLSPSLEVDLKGKPSETLSVGVDTNYTAAEVVIGGAGITVAQNMMGAGLINVIVSTVGTAVLEVKDGVNVIASININVVDTGAVAPTGYFKPQKSHVKVEVEVDVTGAGAAEGGVLFETSYYSDELTLEITSEVADPLLNVHISGESAIYYWIKQPGIYEVAVLHSGNVVGSLIIEVVPNGTEYLNAERDEVVIDLAKTNTMDMNFTTNVDMAEVTFEHTPALSVVYINEGVPCFRVDAAGMISDSLNTVTLKKGEVVLESFNVRVINSNP